MEISQVQPTVNKTWVEQFISVVDRTDVSLLLKGEGSLPKDSSFPSSIRDYISHLAGSRGRQSSPHMNRELSSPSSSPLREGDTGCSSLSPIKPSIELGRSVINVTKI